MGSVLTLAVQYRIRLRAKCREAGPLSPSRCGPLSYRPTPSPAGTLCEGTTLKLPLPEAGGGDNVSFIESTFTSQLIRLLLRGDVLPFFVRRCSRSGSHEVPSLGGTTGARSA